MDFKLGDDQLAIEVKSTDQVRSHHLKGPEAFCKEHPACRAVIVSLDWMKRIMEDGFEGAHITEVLRSLWEGMLI
ncbi:hypothetical protein HOF92_05400 [bacterium]|mgnify:CR=1 FL=1|nr:hypothetical protein [bacterium]